MVRYGGIVPCQKYYIYLCVGDDAHDLGVLLDAAELDLDLLRCLGKLLGVPGERLLLGGVPVLVEPLAESECTKNKNCNDFFRMAR